MAKRVILYSPKGKDPIEVSEHRAEFLKEQGWTSEKSRSVSKTKKEKEEK